MIPSRDATAAMPAVLRYPIAVRRALGPGATSLIAGVLVWEVVARLADALFLPPPSVVTLRLVRLLTNGQLLGPLASSLSNLVFGLAISLVVGLGIGMLVGLSRTAAAALDPYVNALLTAPSLVFAPIFFSIWGLGRESIIALIVGHAIFVMIVNTQAAVRSVPDDLMDMAWVFSASPAQMFRRIVLPASTPFILAGIRLAAGRAVKGMINGELFIALSGLGKLLDEGQNRFDASTVIAVLIVVIAIALALMQAVDRLDSRLTGWLPPSARAN